jgi:hypothetical protein
MAGTKAPLFGLDASGTLGGAIVFSKWRGRTYVRRHAVPSNPKSGLQVGMRSAMKFVTQDWANLSAANQDTWADLASSDNITKLNAQVRYDQRLTRRNLGIWRTPDATAGTTPSAGTIGAPTAQPKTLVLTWTAGANAPEYTWYLYRDTTTGFTADISNLIAIVTAATLTYTDPNLTTGTPYYYLLKGGNYNGELGAASAEATGTPT